MRAHARRLCILSLVLVASWSTARAGQPPAGAITLPAKENNRFANPSYSPDGKWIAMSDGLNNALYLHDAKTKKTIEIANSPSGGYAYNWSPDGSKLGFKLLVPNKALEAPLQVPVVLDVATKTITRLSVAVPRAGVPSFSGDGQIAYTIDQELRITDASGNILKAWTLDNYANLAPISPDGMMVAYNDSDEHIRVLDLSTGNDFLLTDDENGYFNPVWSPDSTRLVVSTTSGWLRGIDLVTGQVYEFGEGAKPSWNSDSTSVYFTRVDRIDGIAVNRADIYEAKFDGNAPTILTADAAAQAGAAYVARNGSKILFTSLEGELYEAPLLKAKKTKLKSLGAAAKLSGADMQIEAGNIQGLDNLDIAQADALAEPLAEPKMIALAAPATTKVGGTVPYIHQVYDTPDNFNGNSACGATSAAMCLAYTGKIGYWDVTVSTPYSHVSHYGRYVCQIYTNNGHTYNIGSPDPNGNTFYGGYGYIVRNNWADTKGYMRDYFNNHSTPSSVDWSPTFAKLKTEINASHPFVLLNSLTSAGHYIVAIGYANSQYTAYFNDPYGNKNTPGYPSYDGAGSYYDWPGYNNGYQNLNTVHCFIYSRADRPVSWAATYRAQSYPATMTAGSTATVWAEFNNTGTGVWQHSQTYLGTQGPQDRSSPFCNLPNWASCSRPSDVDQSAVSNGQVGRFTFILKAPTTPGTYTEKFKLVREGVTWFGPEITWTINVTASGPDTTPPSVPTNLTATATSTGQINLSWSASTDNVGVTGYDIYRNGAYLTSVTGTSYSNTGLAMGTTYSYTVAAYDAADNTSAQCAAKDETTWIILDNVDAGFSASANWTTSTSSTDKYGTNYRWRSTAAVSDQAVWNFNIPTADTYQIYAWWPQGTNRSPTAPYSVNGGTAIPMNQQANGGTWNSLGTFSLAAGSNNVKLSCWTGSGYIVAADAVRVIRR